MPPGTYGCQVVGITISREQFVYAPRWCRGLNVEIQLRDYREVTDQFDRVVSVGMVEHVGYKNAGSQTQPLANPIQLPQLRRGEIVALGEPDKIGHHILGDGHMIWPNRE